MAIDDTAGSDGSHSSSNRSSNRTSPHVVLDFCVDKRHTLAQLFGDLRKSEPIFHPFLSSFRGAPCAEPLHVSGSPAPLSPTPPHTPLTTHPPFTRLPHA